MCIFYVGGWCLTTICDTIYVHQYKCGGARIRAGRVFRAGDTADLFLPYQYFFFVGFAGMHIAIALMKVKLNRTKLCAQSLRELSVAGAFISVGIYCVCAEG